MKNATFVKLALTVSGLATIAYGQSGGVSTWSVQTNTKEWNKALGVTYTRQGCPDAPGSCVLFTGSIALANSVKVVLAIPLNSTTTADYAQQYSQLSQSAAFLAEISIDDFVSQYRALFSVPLAQPATLMATVIANVKSANPELKFGATIYEDDLTSAYLQNSRLPASVRAGFDYIHLFIHYRGHGPNYATYVQQARQLFPKARIIAGSYAVDRRAFLPCLPTGLPCTTSEDFDLFKQSLTLQVQLMNHGAVDRIEFFPGYFGAEAQWPGLTNPRECPSGETSACIANTQAMREAALTILGSKTAVPVWTQLSPTGSLPAPRYGQSAAMDSASHRMIVFGGGSETGYLNDTWILTNANGHGGQPAWIPVTTATAPPADAYSAGMYDPNSNRMMIYGGPAGTDVWVLTDANGLGATAPAWTRLAPAGARPDFLSNWQKHVYDPVRNVMIVYDSSAGVWTLSNANGTGGTPVWKQLHVPSSGPSVRAGFTAVYNPGSNRMIVFGGGGGGVDNNDLWVLTHANGLDGTPSWIPLPLGTAVSPVARSGHTAVYDPASDTMTIFGGIGQPADTWTAAHASGLTQPPVWTLENSGVPSPDPRTDCTAVLDASSFSMIVFGGYNTAMLNSVLVLSPL